MTASLINFNQPNVSFLTTEIVVKNDFIYFCCCSLCIFRENYNIAHGSSSANETWFVETLPKRIEVNINGNQVK